MKPLLIHPGHLLAWHQQAAKIQGLDLNLVAPMRPGASCDSSGMTAQQSAMTYLAECGWIAPYLHMIDAERGIAEIRLEGGVYQLTSREECWYADYIICNRLAMAAVNTALTHEGIRAVKVVVNSPGGTCVGTPELARALAALAAAKPVIGVSDSMAASAGYWPLAGCGTIYVSPSSDIGSVGVYSMHLDLSKTYASYYQTDVNLVRDGERKAEMLREMTDEMRLAWQTEVDAIALDFRTSIRSLRGVEINEAFLQGQCLSGTAALVAGMVDAVMDDPHAAALADLVALLAVA